MSLKDDEQRNIQMKLDFSSALMGAARGVAGVAGDESESLVTTSGTKSKLEPIDGWRRWLSEKT